MRHLARALILTLFALLVVAPATAATVGDPGAGVCPAISSVAGEAASVEPVVGWPGAEIIWLGNTCTVTIQCAEGGSVSCSSANNNCTTSGDCAICDGIQDPSKCCPNACLDLCLDFFVDCISACPPGIGPCNIQCRNERQACEAQC